MVMQAKLMAFGVLIVTWSVQVATVYQPSVCGHRGGGTNSTRGL